MLTCHAPVEDPRVENVYGMWVVRDGLTGKVLDGPFTGDRAYEDACRALGRRVVQQLGVKCVEDFVHSCGVS